MDNSHCWIYFFYGLTFFSMGLAILLEIGRGPNSHLRNALRPLAAFGFLHGFNEWLEMFGAVGKLPMQEPMGIGWEGIRLGLLAFSFLSLTAFGAALLSQRPWWRRASLLFPMVQAAIWGLGVVALRSNYGLDVPLMAIGEAWTRYVLGVPSALVASVGLIFQQRAFRHAGLSQFGRDSLWAAVGFAWYGAIGQSVVSASALPPSQFLNEDTFLEAVGVPIQIVRAAAGLVASIFVMRFLRASEVETRRQIEELRQARLDEAERRQSLRGELLKQVVTAQEAERKRVARELHDDTGQALTALGLGLRAASRSLESDPEKARKNIDELENLVDRSLDDLQRLITDLRPSHLDDLGLPAALRWYAKEVEDRAHLEVQVQVEGQTKVVPPPVNTTLFRVAQEALTNVVKHAGASRAEVSLGYGAEAVTLSVRDNGRGFDPHTLSEMGRSSWGLLGMEERASLLGGEWQLTSGRGQGTQVQVRIPYEEGGEERDDDQAAAG